MRAEMCSVSCIQQRGKFVGAASRSQQHTSAVRKGVKRFSPRRVATILRLNPRANVTNSDTETEGAVNHLNVQNAHVCVFTKTAMINSTGCHTYIFQSWKKGNRAKANPCDTLTCLFSQMAPPTTVYLDQWRSINQEPEKQGWLENKQGSGSRGAGNSFVGDHNPCFQQCLTE